MIDYDNIPDEILTRYLERHGLPETEASYEHAANAGVRELFHAWLCYEGILGYTDKILNMVDTLRHIDKSTELPVSQQTVLAWLGALQLDQENYRQFLLAHFGKIKINDWPIMVESLNTL